MCRGAEAKDALVCIGNLQEICADELVAAEQWCRRCSGGGGVRKKIERAEKSCCSIASCSAPCILKHPAGAEWRWLGDDSGMGYGGEGRKQRDSM